MLALGGVRILGWAAICVCVVGVACSSDDSDPGSTSNGGVSNAGGAAPAAGGKALGGHAGSHAGEASSEGGAGTAGAGGRDDVVGGAGSNLGGTVSEGGTSSEGGSAASGGAEAPDPCTLECLNAGSCRTTSEGEICVCPAPFAGARCELNAKVLADEPYVVPPPPAAPEPVCTPVTTLEANVSATSTADLEALRGVSVLKGSATIGGGVDDLSALACLTQIQGSLLVKRNTALSNLAGLRSLRQVTGDVSIGNTVLRSLDGLEQLTWVGGSLEIGISEFQLVGAFPLLRYEPNPTLVDISALRSLHRVDEKLRVVANQSLGSLHGLEQLTQVPSIELRDDASLSSIAALAGVVKADIDIEWCTALEDLHGLENLSSGALVLLRNESLTKLDALAGLKHCSALNIAGSPLITNIDALGGLESCGSLSIWDTQITNVEAFSKLTSSKSVSFKNNAELVNLDGLRNLAWIEANLELVGNGSLRSLKALQGITALRPRFGASGPALEIQNNGALESLEGLENLSSVDGDVRILENAALPDLDGLLRMTAINGSLEIVSNVALRGLSGVRNLEQVNGDLKIVGNVELVSLAGLSSLRSVALNFVLNDTDFLEDLDGLEAFRAAKYIEIGGHQSLTSLHALGAFRGDTPWWFHDNPVLPDCEILWLQWSAYGRRAPFHCP